MKIGDRLRPPVALALALALGTLGPHAAFANGAPSASATAAASAAPPSAAPPSAAPASGAPVSASPESATPAPAQAVATLPFKPPVDFQPLPSALMPKKSTTWSAGSSAFSISQLPDGVNLPPDTLMRTLSAQTAALGTVKSSGPLTVCRAPASRIVIDSSDTKSEFTEQVQTIAGTTYVINYTHPIDTPPDAGIAAILDSYCGSAPGTPSPTPPTGWVSNDQTLLGIWLGDGVQTIVAMASEVQPDMMSRAKDVMESTVKTSNVTIVDRHFGTLCGLPAAFLKSTVTSSGQGPVDITFEFTQSATAAYTLVYSHPDSQPERPSAVASLASLCAILPDAAKTALAP